MQRVRFESLTVKELLRHVDNERDTLSKEELLQAFRALENKLYEEQFRSAAQIPLPL